jgi:50S ribosomal protein L16 3-hydroxylase
MNIETPLTLLGGLSPRLFMQRHWQKKPLLIRQAWPGVAPPLTRAQALAAVSNPDLESRLVVQTTDTKRGGNATTTLRRGPMPRRALPSPSQPGWTVLLQGLDLHVDAAHAMLQRFRFVPDALLDDVMLSWASLGGGVGPHTDDYDVFLLQVQGRRHWRVGPAKQPQWVDGAALKRLSNFNPTMAWTLDAGDMLYLPPQWGHDGVAVDGECMTCSIGFRAPSSHDLARDLLQSLDDDAPEPTARAQQPYRHPSRGVTGSPARLAPELQAFAQGAVQQQLQRQLQQLQRQPALVSRALGQWATEPKPQVWFEANNNAHAPMARPSLVLHARTRMMYDDLHIFINGEAFEAAGVDAKMMRKLANDRCLPSADVARLGEPAWALVSDWVQSGWMEHSRD